MAGSHTLPASIVNDPNPFVTHPWFQYTLCRCLGRRHIPDLMCSSQALSAADGDRDLLFTGPSEQATRLVCARM